MMEQVSGSYISGWNPVHSSVRSADGKSVEISEQQMKWLLEGLKIEQKTAFKESRKMYV